MQPGGMRIHRPDPELRSPCSRCARPHPASCAGTVDTDELEQWTLSRRLIGAHVCLRCLTDDDLERIADGMARLVRLSAQYSCDPVHTDVAEDAFTAASERRRSAR